jgi:glycolate oxidase FAD binding subunit
MVGIEGAGSPHGPSALSLVTCASADAQGNGIGPGHMNDLAKTLKGIVGAPHVRDNGERAARAVDGIVPALAVFPGAVEEVSAVLRACHAAKVGVVPWGGGTSMGMGGIPRRADVALVLTRLDQVIDHEPGDLTSTVQAGMTLAGYQSSLGRHRQFLALDPPGAERATVGGVLAANASGPHRLRYGTARDLLIGVRVVHADGTVTKGGAKVVKNVTGYDMNKLYIGSLGTLGVIVEATFRLYPLPPAERTWVAPFPTAAKAGAAVGRILDSPLVPSAVELLNETAAAEVGRRAGVGPGPGAAVLAVAVASVPEAVEDQLRRAREMGVTAGGAEGQTLDGPAHEAFWAAVRDGIAAEGACLVLKASVLLTRVADAVWQGESLAARHGLRVAIVSEAGSGIVRYTFRAEGTGADRFARLAEVAGRLRAFAAEARGSLVILAAPPEVKRTVDAWGSVGDAFPLMRNLKEQFDPDGILNPGRFVGGL